MEQRKSIYVFTGVGRHSGQDGIYKILYLMANEETLLLSPTDNSTQRLSDTWHADFWIKMSSAAHTSAALRDVSSQPTQASVGLHVGNWCPAYTLFIKLCLSHSCSPVHTLQLLHGLDSRPTIYEA